MREFDTLCFGLALANVRFLWTIGRDIYSFIFIIHCVSFAMGIERCCCARALLKNTISDEISVEKVSADKIFRPTKVLASRRNFVDLAGRNVVK